jgi:hypothetical protein
MLNYIADSHSFYNKNIYLDVNYQHRIKRVIKEDILNTSFITVYIF